MKSLLLLWSFCVAVPQVGGAATPPATPQVVDFKILPIGHDTTLPAPVGRVRYYLLNEFLQLATFDSELVSDRAQLVALGNIQTELKKQLGDKDTQIQALTAEKQIFSDRSARLDTDLTKCQHDLVNASKAPIWPYVVAIVGGVVGIFGVGMWAGHH
jgi:hypothetical protein